MDSYKKLPLKKRKYYFSFDLNKSFVPSPPLKKIKKLPYKKRKYSFDLNKSFGSSPPLKKMKQSSSCVKSSCWIKSRFLGRGSYGSVHLATRDIDNKMVAIKSAEISRASSLMFEKRILTRLSSPFVVGCYGDEITHENVFIFGKKPIYNLILEYCSGHSLAELMKMNGGGLVEKDVKVFAKDILNGLSYIHSQKIIHCDIKPDNIFLSHVGKWISPNGYIIKIGDFGLAMEKGSIQYGNGSGHHTRGTTNYMAPELITHGIMDYGVDTWAFGCTVLEMLTGELAWGGYNNLGPDEMVKLIGQSSYIPHIPNWLSQTAQDFLRRCLVREPLWRWKISELKKHPFFQI